MGLFCKRALKKDHILQKRPIILRSLLIVATPYSEDSSQYRLFYRALLQKRPIILRSLPIICETLPQQCEDGTDRKGALKSIKRALESVKRALWISSWYGGSLEVAALTAKLGAGGGESGGLPPRATAVHASCACAAARRRRLSSSMDCRMDALTAALKAILL